MIFNNLRNLIAMLMLSTTLTQCNTKTVDVEIPEIAIEESSVEALEEVETPTEIINEEPIETFEEIVEEPIEQEIEIEQVEEVEENSKEVEIVEEEKMVEVVEEVEVIEEEVVEEVVEEKIKTPANFFEDKCEEDFYVLGTYGKFTFSTDAFENGKSYVYGVGSDNFDYIKFYDDNVTMPKGYIDGEWYQLEAMFVEEELAHIFKARDEYYSNMGK